MSNFEWDYSYDDWRSLQFSDPTLFLEKMSGGFNSLGLTSVGVRDRVYDLMYSITESHFVDGRKQVRYSARTSLASSLNFSITVADLGLDPKLYDLSMLWFRLQPDSEYADVYREFHQFHTSTIIGGLGGLIALGSYVFFSLTFFSSFPVFPVFPVFSFFFFDVVHFRFQLFYCFVVICVLLVVRYHFSWRICILTDSF